MNEQCHTERVDSKCRECGVEKRMLLTLYDNYSIGEERKVTECLSCGFWTSSPSKWTSTFENGIPKMTKVDSFGTMSIEELNELREDNFMKPKEVN